MKNLGRINAWWFGYGSPVTMGVVRMSTGFLAFVNLLLLLPDFEAWFTEQGFTPAWFAERWAGGAARLNLLAGVTDDRVTALVFGLALVASVLTMVGLATRVSSIALFVLLVTLHHRTPDILHSGDTLLRQMAFLVMLAPSGAACSLDRLIGLWRGTAPSVPKPVSVWPQRLMQFQVAVVYLTTVWHKMVGTTWRDGTATWYPAHLREFERFPVPAFIDHQPFVALTTYGTLAVEVALGTLVFYQPARKWVLIGGVLLHASIEYRFNIPLFGWVMVSTYSAFFSGEEVTAWAKTLGAKWRRWRLEAVYPDSPGADPAKLRAVQAADAFGLVTFTPGNVRAWSVAGPTGPEEGAVKPRLLSRCVGFWWLWPVYPVWSSLLDKVARVQGRGEGDGRGAEEDMTGEISTQGRSTLR
ncbi:MAG: HTTM domain-containing protein [Fimbriimonadaceae bacterium]|nr:HTTM domain-containing protein [Fimbriimonadaceae bacterium]QYK57806.1 MAG: HTTM domain-containing protein [Fimbriimonadaceae bacterium]